MRFGHGCGRLVIFLNNGLGMKLPIFLSYDIAYFASGGSGLYGADYQRHHVVVVLQSILKPSEAATELSFVAFLFESLGAGDLPAYC